MAVPKGKVSKARRDKRRSSTWKLAVPGLVACPKCAVLCTCLTECARSAAATMAVRSKLSSPWRRSKRQLLALGGKRILPSFTFARNRKGTGSAPREKSPFSLAIQGNYGYNRFNHSTSCGGSETHQRRSGKESSYVETYHRHRGPPQCGQVHAVQ